MNRICRHCRNPENEHCRFEPITLPAGCVCDPGTWGDMVRPVCDRYHGDGDSYCATCEHDRKCHERTS